jgi:hypothetical protein
MPAAGVALVPMGLTRSAASRAGFRGRKDAAVDACGGDAWCINGAREIGAVRGYAGFRPTAVLRSLRFAARNLTFASNGCERQFPPPFGDIDAVRLVYRKLSFVPSSSGQQFPPSVAFW